MLCAVELVCRGILESRLFLNMHLLLVSVFMPVFLVHLCSEQGV